MPQRIDVRSTGTKSVKWLAPCLAPSKHQDLFLYLRYFLNRNPKLVNNSLYWHVLLPLEHKCHPLSAAYAQSFVSILNPPVPPFSFSSKHWWVVPLNSSVTSRRFSVTQYMRLQISCGSSLQMPWPVEPSQIVSQPSASRVRSCMLPKPRVTSSAFLWRLPSLLFQSFPWLLHTRADSVGRTMITFVFILRQPCHIIFNLLWRKGPTEAKEPRAHESHNAALLRRGVSGLAFLPPKNLALRNH